MDDESIKKKKRVITTLLEEVVVKLDRLAKERACSRDALVAQMVTSSLEETSVASAPVRERDESGANVLHLEELQGSVREFAASVGGGLADLHALCERSLHAQEQVARAMFGSFLKEEAQKKRAREFLSGLFGEALDPNGREGS